MTVKLNYGDKELWVDEWAGKDALQLDDHVNEMWEEIHAGVHKLEAQNHETFWPGKHDYIDRLATKLHELTDASAEEAKKKGW